ncbi:DegT/DnrJ/EryC1/StrS family aminotransferase [Baaleninema simplex]|uniref:DegT/DnrJ/EryC1/StrS family aminotransferase n=1 Tax=Baaleninema simplex TaxID=2862350 RepID=UPI00034BF361|nr:DegT/DnrJ/EryC1/StrS family aminotransferase [Baaleninema simplex]
MTSIPPIDLGQQYRTIASELETAVLKVMASGRYIGGDGVTQFEQQFSDYVGTTHCVSCNSGTDALYLALRALEIGAGDEVVTTPFSFFATVEVISAVGATPVFVDIDPKTFNLDVAAVEAALSDRTKAILPVHLFGRPVEMSALMEISASRNIAIVEDCAQATGATWNDRQVGSFGRIGCFSFFPTKNLGGFGDGGAMTTNDPELARRLRVLKEHGSTRRYVHEEIGINSRLDAIQAAILQVKLGYLDKWNAQRREIARRYAELLRPIPHVVLPSESDNGGESVWNQYTIRLSTPLDRDRVRESLQTLGVSTMVYYPIPLHRQPVYRELGYDEGSFPAAETVCREVLSLPMFPELTPDQQQAIAYRLKEAIGD